VNARPPLQCKRCGCYAVQWAQTNAGKWYLVIRIFDATPESRAWLRGGGARRPHSCATHARHDAASEQHQAEYYAKLAAR
jgi:hypothetical protein